MLYQSQTNSRRSRLSATNPGFELTNTFLERVASNVNANLGELATYDIELHGWHIHR
jgi:hypothetical protein